MGERIYGLLESPEEDVYAAILAELRQAPEIKQLQVYLYEFANDEDGDEDVPGDHRLPAIRLEIASNPAAPSSNVYEDNRMALAVICWVPGHHRADAFGFQHTLRRILFRKATRHALANATGEARAYPVGFQQGPVIRIGQPRVMRAEAVVTIEYRVATFKE